MKFYEILALIIISGIVIRFTFRFDLNRYLESRRKIKIDQLKNICPHCKIEILKDNQVKVESYFHSPFGTTNYICSRCQCVVPSEEDAIRICKNYAKDPKKFLKNEKKFFKKMKKLRLA